MKEYTRHIRITLIEEMLGTSASDPEIYKKYIASKAPDASGIEDEIARLGVDGVVENAMTIFQKEDGNPIIWPYQIKGFFKSAQKAMNDTVDKGGRKESKVYLPSYKGKIDQLVFVKAKGAMVGEHAPIRIQMPEGAEMGFCERPLRAETPQGPRVALALSETVPIGSVMEFDVVCLHEGIHERIPEWLDYGKYNGLGQWRNSGRGSYVWEELDDDGNVIGGNAFVYK